MNRFTSILIGLILLFCGNILSQDGVFRVMSYNIRYAGDEKIDGENAWSKRKEQVSTMIRFHKADIIGLQEALKLQIDDLVQLLPYFEFAGAGRDDGKNKGEFSVILYNKNKFDELDNGTFWLSETPGVPSKGWDAAFPRICSWIKLKQKITGKVFFIFNTHLDHISQGARTNGSGLIIDSIIAKGSGYPVILTGDFNYRQSEDGYKKITGGDSPMKDAQFVSKNGHYGSDVTFNNFGKELTPGNKIDYIFVNDKISVIEHGVISEMINKMYPSDHMPVVAEVEISNSKD